jgi:hypothetical protein
MQMRKTLLILVTAVLVPFIVLAQSPKASDFKIVSFNGKWIDDKFYVIGEVKNNGGIPAGVQIEAIARDLSGTFIIAQKFWPNTTNNMPPGGSCEIKHPVTEDRNAQRVEVRIVAVRVW